MVRFGVIQFLPRKAARAFKLCLAMIGLLSAALPAGAAPAVGEAAPQLVAATFAGETFDLAALRGKVVLVNYWATWCIPCRRELPLLDAFYRRYRDQGVALISISIDRAGDIEQARKTGAELSYPVAVAKDLTTDGFGVPNAVPVTYVIDTNGVVRDRLVAIRETLLSEVVLPLLLKAASGN